MKEADEEQIEECIKEQYEWLCDMAGRKKVVVPALKFQLLFHNNFYSLLLQS